MFKCRYKIGLLTLSDCNKPTDTACVHCNRTVCEEHRHERDEGPVCLECLAEKYPDDQLGPDGLRARWRNRLFNTYDYHPRFYSGGRGMRGGGGRHVQDYETFDEDKELEDEIADEELDDLDDEETAADFQDS